MIPYNLALTKILGFAEVNAAERVPIPDAQGRILAENIISDTDMPPFDKSAMDGFAYKSADLDKELDIVETIPAGSTPKRKIETGQCARIMTGAPLPAGADCVVIHEDTVVSGNKIKILRSQLKRNICYLGEDVKKGEIVLEKGICIAPQHISVLASVGNVQPLVYKHPEVTVLITGSEVVEPEQKPDGSKIRNSNGYQLISQLKEAGCRALYNGIVEDNIEHLKDAFTNAFKQSEILIVTGGASKGDFDFVPDVLKSMQFVTHFTEVAIQPGKPFNFSTRENLICFGLSGNPVSSFFQFELLVKPFLRKIAGNTLKPKWIKATLGEKTERKKTEREYFFPIRFSDEFIAFPVEFHGSAHIHSLAYADGIASIPVGTNIIEKGEFINVRPI